MIARLVLVVLALAAGCTTRTMRLERDAVEFRVYSRYGAEQRVSTPVRHLPLRVGRAEVEVPVERLRRVAVGGLNESGRLFVTLTHEDGRELGGTLPAGLTVADGAEEVALRDLDFLELEHR